MHQTLRIRIGFFEYALLPANAHRLTSDRAPRTTLLTAGDASATLRAWAARAPTAERALRTFYGGPVRTGSQHRGVHGLLERALRDVVSGRLVLVRSVRDVDAAKRFERAGVTGARVYAGSAIGQPGPRGLAPVAAPRASAEPDDEAVPPSDSLLEPDVDAMAQVATLVAAAAAGAPFCEECTRRASAARERATSEPRPAASVPAQPAAAAGRGAGSDPSRPPAASPPSGAARAAAPATNPGQSEPASNVSEQSPRVPPVGPPTPPPLRAMQPSPDVERIRACVPGVLRPEEELSDADLATLMNSQLLRVEAEDVDAMIAAFAPEDQEQARLVMARASGFGNIESMNALRAAMDPHLANGAALYTPGSGSVADNVSYLASKSTFAGQPGVTSDPLGKLPDSDQLAPGSIVVLDRVVLDRIERDPTFARALEQYECTLLEPLGLEAGINMFNAPSSESIVEHTRRVLGRSRELRAADSGLTFESAINPALSERARSTLERANPELLARVQQVDPAAACGESSEEIAHALSGDAGVSEAQVAANLATFTPFARPLMRELFAAQCEIFSMRRFANAITSLHSAVLETAARAGVPAENVYFYVPSQGKSYGIMALTHREATGTPASRYLNGPNDLVERSLPEGAAIVILDDVAGSGDSLVSAVEFADAAVQRAGRLLSAVIVAPMIATEVASERFRGLVQRRGGAGAGSVVFQPHAMVNSIAATPLYSGLDGDYRYALKELTKG